MSDKNEMTSMLLVAPASIMSEFRRAVEEMEINMQEATRLAIIEFIIKHKEK